MVCELTIQTTTSKQKQTVHTTTIQNRNQDSFSVSRKNDVSICKVCEVYLSVPISEKQTIKQDPMARSNKTPITQ